MRVLLLLAALALAGCGDVNHPGDEPAAQAECINHAHLWYWTTTSIHVQTNRVWWLDVTCRDGTKVTIRQGNK